MIVIVKKTLVVVKKKETEKKAVAIRNSIKKAPLIVINTVGVLFYVLLYVFLPIKSLLDLKC